MQKVLTVSIAAYNVQEFLEETLESLVDERYSDELEVLIVDDGSKDKTGEIARCYQERYPNTFKYIKKENGGHGSTINRGMELATGRYFRIIDGDDYVNKDEFSQYFEKLKAINADIVLTDFRVVNSNGEVKTDPAVIENGVNPFTLLSPNSFCTFNKSISTRVFGLSSLTIKTELLKKRKVRITEKCFYVDVEFIIWCIFLADSYIYYDYPVYMYRKDDNCNNSVNKANMIKNVDMQKKVALRLCELYEMFSHEINEGGKKDIIRDRIAISIGALYRTYMLMDKHSYIRGIRSTESEIRDSYPKIYKDLNSNGFIRCIRFMNNSLVGIIRIAYRIYIGRK